MCKMASFLYKNSEANGVEIAVYKLDSHSDTQRALKLTEKMGWFEGHYTPSGEIECRKPNGIDNDAMAEIKRRYKNFNAFLKWALKQNVDFSGWLNLNGCDLKGVKLPASIGGGLDLSGCDLKGVKLPDSFGGTLYLSGCNLKGVKLPASIGGWLDLRGCKNVNKDVVNKIKIGDTVYW